MDTTTTTTPTVEDRRTATCWLNYPSRVVPDPTKPLGPNLLGELLWPVECEHHDDGSTSVGFSLIAPPNANPFIRRKGATS